MTDSNTAPTLEPYAEEWLNVEAMFGGRFVLSGSVNDIRQQFAGLWQDLASKLPPPSDAIEAQDIVVPENGQRVRIYTPKAGFGTKELPIGLYIHSGGFVAGAIENEDHIARDIAERVPMVIISTSYRLAPEHPFPAGLEDCIASYRWMHKNASSFSTSPQKAVVMGGSAGGNLACAVTLSLIDEPEVMPQGLIMACASTTDARVIPEDLKMIWHPERLLDAAMLNREAMAPCLEAYGASPNEPLYSILLHPSLSKLPQTWLAACSKDPTYDEMLMFYNRLQKDGVDVKLEIFKGYPHFFWMLPMLSKSQEFIKEWAERVREMVGKPV